MTYQRAYTSKRTTIVKALVEKLKEIDGSGDYLTDLGGEASSTLVFWDEITEFPSVHVTAGSETRLYQGGGYRDRFLSVTIRCYINNEEAMESLESLLEDVETVIETNSKLHYIDKNNNNQYTHQISILTIDTDEGSLSPLGVGEITCEVRY
jgi:hypothetical protein